MGQYDAEIDEDAMIALKDFDFDKWINEEERMKSNHNVQFSDTNNIDGTEPGYKCPICNEICDTLKALQVHIDECCDKQTNAEQNQQQNEWKNILNMKQKK